jgi:hypothetical protein
MKKIIKLNESDLTRIVKEVLNENSFNHLKRRNGGLSISEMDIVIYILENIWDELSYEHELEALEKGWISNPPKELEPYIKTVIDLVLNNSFYDDMWNAVAEKLYRENDVVNVMSDIISKIKSELKN